MINVALFPIPGAVSFPGVPQSLHVFEPRYRQMVKHCVSENLPMGICHTRKVIREGSDTQTREEALSSNQSTYQPEAVFSAGPVEVLEELPDGRLLIQVSPEQRLRLNEELQTLPFSIWACEAFPDEMEEGASEQSLAQGKDKIMQRLLILTHDQPDIRSVLMNDFWQSMPADRFSFAVTGMISMPPEMAQALLEQPEPQRRLDEVLSMINGIPRSIP